MYVHWAFRFLYIHGFVHSLLLSMEKIEDLVINYCLEEPWCAWQDIYVSANAKLLGVVWHREETK